MVNYDQVKRIQNEWPHYLKWRRSTPVKRVVGGRWFVRKRPVDDNLGHPYFLPEYLPRNYPWKAWTTGKNKKYSHWFKTHASAIAWASYVAQCQALDEIVDMAVYRTLIAIDNGRKIE